MKNRLLKIIPCGVMLFGAYSHFAHAGCASFNDLSDTSSFGDVVVQRDAAIGSIVKTIHTPTSTSNWAGNCDGKEQLGYTLAYSSTLAPYGEHIYQTSVPGIGIRVVNKSSTSMTFDSPQSVYNYGNSSIGWYGARAELIVIGRVSSGKLPAGPLATMAATDTNGIFHIGYIMYLAESTITAAACSLTSGPSLTFPIGDVPAEQFTAPGTVSQQTSTVNLGLNCDANANINISLNGQQNADSSDRSVLALSHQGENGVADGVGVQLIYNNVPLTINNVLRLKQSAGGQENFPVTARYIQTKNIVRPGTANAAATLTLTYQ